MTQNIVTVRKLREYTDNLGSHLTDEEMAGIFEIYTKACDRMLKESEVRND